LGSWEARLNAREEALKKREQVVAEAEGRIGVRIYGDLYSDLVAVKSFTQYILGICKM